MLFRQFENKKYLEFETFNKVLYEDFQTGCSAMQLILVDAKKFYTMQLIS